MYSNFESASELNHLGLQWPNCLGKTEVFPSYSFGPYYPIKVMIKTESHTLPARSWQVTKLGGKGSQLVSDARDNSLASLPLGKKTSIGTIHPLWGHT